MVTIAGKDITVSKVSLLTRCISVKFPETAVVDSFKNIIELLQM